MTDQRHPDVDELPERAPNSMLGVLEVSAYVESYEEAEELGILDNYKKFLEKGNATGPIRCWYLRASGLDVKRDDDKPFYQTDLLRLVDKRGRPLTQGMPPADLSAQFRSLGLSASPAKVGADDSAVGRVFQFEETSRPYGKTFSKSFSLWPTELKPVGFEYDGEVTIVAVSTNDAGDETPTDAPKLSEDVASKVLVKALADKTPAQMLDAVLATESLKGVSNIFGVDLLEAATDETLADVLIAKGLMTKNGSGTLTPATEATVA
jgi:hypothetical protein